MIRLYRRKVDGLLQIRRTSSTGALADVARRKSARAKAQAVFVEPFVFPPERAQDDWTLDELVHIERRYGIDHPITSMRKASPFIETLVGQCDAHCYE